MKIRYVPWVLLCVIVWAIVNLSVDMVYHAVCGSFAGVGVILLLCGDYCQSNQWSRNHPSVFNRAFLFLFVGTFLSMVCFVWVLIGIFFLGRW